MKAYSGIDLESDAGREVLKESFVTKMWQRYKEEIGENRGLDW